MEILAALAKGLMSSLASQIFNKIFGGHDAEYYFNQMITEIKALLHIEAVSNDITNIKGKLDGVISQMKIEYANKVAAGADNEALLTFLQPIDRTMDEDVMGPLQALTDVTQAKGNAQQSLLVFMVGGGLQMSILQEMAKRDPAAKGDPTKSQYAKDVQDYAVKYHTRGMSLFKNLRQSRMDAISPVTCMGNAMDVATLDDFERPEGEPPMSETEAVGWPTGTRNYTFHVKDGWTGKDVCEFTSEGSIWYPCSKELAAYGKSKSARATYYTDQENAFNETWDSAGRVLQAWEKLQSTPLPEA